MYNCCTWWAGAGQGPNDTYDFGGFLTHEMGHLVKLIDIYDDTSCASETAYQTMCGTFGPEFPTPTFHLNDSYWYRTLTSHDIAAANEVYRQVYR